MAFETGVLRASSLAARCQKQAPHTRHLTSPCEALVRFLVHHAGTNAGLSRLKLARPGPPRYMCPARPSRARTASAPQWWPGLLPPVFLSDGTGELRLPRLAPLTLIHLICSRVRIKSNLPCLGHLLACGSADTFSPSLHIIPSSCFSNPTDFFVRLLLPLL